jgi:hypothetical protein
MCTYHEYYGEHIVCDFPMSQQQHYIQCTVSVTLSYSTVAMVLKNTDCVEHYSFEMVMHVYKLTNVLK